MPNQDHISVMPAEVLEYLQVQPDKWYIDATFGRGGHTRSILEAGGNVIAFDVDQEAIEFGQETFAQEISQGNLILLRANFEDLTQELRKLQQLQVSGILFDFGTSTNQLMSNQRGFSFTSEAPLDMRMDQRLGVTANDLLNVLSEKQLADLFLYEGGESEARSIAKAIKNYQVKQGGQLHFTAKELADLITKTKHRPSGKLHPATKVFQALRIAVNRELDAIAAVLPQVADLLEKGGRIVTIAFHEGEDRLVKQHFNRWAASGRGDKVIKKSIEPSPAELEQNPRARSARMRVYQV